MRHEFNISWVISFLFLAFTIANCGEDNIDMKSMNHTGQKDSRSSTYWEGKNFKNDPTKKDKRGSAYWEIKNFRQQQTPVGTLDSLLTRSNSLVDSLVGVGAEAFNRIYLREGTHLFPIGKWIVDKTIVLQPNTKIIGGYADTLIGDRTPASVATPPNESKDSEEIDSFINELWKEETVNEPDSRELPNKEVFDTR